MPTDTYRANRIGIIQRGVPVRFTVVRLEPVETAELDNALGLANQTQNAMDFVLYPDAFRVPAKYKLPNSGWDLDAAVKELLRSRNFPRPVIFFTGLPYSDRDNRKTPDWFYFAEYDLNGDAGVNIVSTYLWNNLPGQRRPQPYILLSLGTIALSYLASLPMHEELRGCPFDYCDNPPDIDRALRGAAMCQDCSRKIDKALRSHGITIKQVAAAERLINRAADRRLAFVVMPFRRELAPTYRVLEDVLRANNWDVLRADKMPRPRRITDAIIQAIHKSDLVIADLTGYNPNVFYELGVAHTVGCDVLMISQSKKIPFDLQDERAIFYHPTEHGLRKLAADLKPHLV